MEERPPRSSELVISVPISVSSVLKAVELMLAPETAAVFAGAIYTPFDWRGVVASYRKRPPKEPL